MFDQCTVHDVFTTDTDDSHEDCEWKVALDVTGKKLTVEIDSGARCNVVSKNTAEAFQSVSAIQQSDAIINGVSGKPMKAFGKINLPCAYKNIKRDVEFQVLDIRRNVNLLGRDECTRFGLIARINSVQLTTDDILSEYSDVVGDEIGCIPGNYEIKIDETVQPVVQAPRPVPAAIRNQVEKELNNLQKCGIIASVTEPTAWVNSLVCVRKKNGRVSIDPTDLNKAVQREHYPMNGIDDVVTGVHGSKYFSTVDANKGYYQIRLTERSSYLTTFNTPFGRFRYLRLPMGLKCAGEVFQREMVNHFGSLDGVEVVVDDMLIYGKILEEHNARLRKVLDKARTINLKLNKGKCVLTQPEVDYVGHRVTGEGLKPTEKRIEAIVHMKDPENHSELETILGMLAYVSKFIPNLSELNAPL
ncbi:uncharacterized protein K02A2.6-like [Mizuhopecten yessoensis]|uniref:uncharacterized protein K02A2.6-like n=1 Tax=Mizuhopecten yessoensis TaxID=6573 RepID=UPI000B45E17E|nr:uncharacterized protein K02A2.6-like [Mizuhopecten yessoensis]